MQSRPERLYRPLPQQKDGEMNQVEKAARFAELHVKGAPLLLYNAWDAGTAKSILDAGAKAIATSSWAVAEAQGYRDGESIPITFVEQIIARIVSTIEAPVSVDFEGGYSDDNGALAENAARLLELGIIGINFEDRVVQGAGLYPIDQHARRIAAIREAARAEGVDLFIKRGQICFWVNNATRQTLLTTLWTARKPMPPQERPASSFRACGTMR
jgi:2-methylisocitrate lyase-like PEP mutase family enzyme